MCVCVHNKSLTPDRFFDVLFSLQVVILQQTMSAQMAEIKRLNQAAAALAADIADKNTALEVRYIYLYISIFMSLSIYMYVSG